MKSLPVFLIFLLSATTFAADLSPKCRSLAQAYADNMTGKSGTSLVLADVYEVDLNEGAPLAQVELYVNQDKKLFIFTTYGAKNDYLRNAQGTYIPVPNPGRGCTVDSFPSPK